jgi:hypothetical protein
VEEKEKIVNESNYFMHIHGVSDVTQLFCAVNISRSKYQAKARKQTLHLVRYSIED